MTEKLKIQHFDIIYDLMKKSFPNDEYRTYDEQKALLNNPLYSVYVLYEKEQLIKAFISVWEFDDFAYIEHFAVSPEFRNGGTGSKMLKELLDLTKKTTCLEVEPPENEINRRRIGFYERNNFFFNEYPYIQPPMSEGKKPVPLFIMTSGGKIDKNTFEHIKTTLYSQVYKCR